MTKQEIRAVYPLIESWMKQNLADHASVARPMASLGFRRLAGYFFPPSQASSSVVVVARVPVPSLSAVGLSSFSDFEPMDAGGVTCLDTYFVQGRQRSIPRPSMSTPLQP